MPKKTDNTDRAILDRIERVGELLKELSPETLGHRIKRIRDQQCISIRDVAEKANISKNSIVRLEQGRGSRPITILKICTVLGIHIERLAKPTNKDFLFAVKHFAKDDQWFDAADMASRSLLGVQQPLSPRERKKAVAQGAIMPVNLLKSRLPEGCILPSVLEIYQKSPDRSHAGEEFAYILSGTAIITIHGKKHRLKTGESIAFWSAEPHSYAPADPANVPVRILSIRVDG